MEILRIVLTILFVIDCIGLTVIILMQEENLRDLEASPEWPRPTGEEIKGRSMEGALVKATRIMGVLFFVLALVLNLNF